MGHNAHLLAFYSVSVWHIDLFTKAPDLNSYIYATLWLLSAVDFTQNFVNFKQFLMGSLPVKPI